MARVLAVAIGLGLLAGCGGGGGDSPPDRGQVNVAGFHFAPVRVEVATGGNVTFMNHGDNAHTVSADQGSPTSFDTDRLAPGERATVNFDAPGSYPYVCRFHPLMTGVVEVTQ